MSRRNRNQRQNGQQREGREKKQEMIRQQKEKEREHKEQLAGLQFNEQGQLSRAVIQEMTDTSALQDETIETIQNYITRNWVLSNLTDAQEHDFWYKFSVMQLKILGEHPPQESGVVGPLRAFLYDDPAEDKMPLSAAERNQIDTFFDTLKAQVTRNREGYEREMLSTQIRESRTDRAGPEEQSDSGGAISGLFS